MVPGKLPAIGRQSTGSLRTRMDKAKMQKKAWALNGVDSDNNN